MSLKGWTVAAGMALPILPNASHAATEANFAAATTGDLIAATPDNAIGTAAVNFCEGFAQGAVLVEMQNMAAFRGPKLFNMPNPPPSRDDALSEFVKWARASPDRMSASSTDGLFRFLSDATLAPNLADQIGPGNPMNKLLLLAAVALPVVACADGLRPSNAH